MYISKYKLNTTSIMKKSILVIIITLAIGVQVKSQDDFSPSGNFSFDLNFDPAAIFDAAAGSVFTMPFIKGRYFLGSGSAIRLGLSAEFDSDKEYSDADGDISVKNSSMLIGIAPGYEKQFGTKRFYFYLGGELPITSYSTKSKAEYNGDTYVSKNPGNSGYFGIGLHFVIGVDFYIFPNFYLGAEFTPGYIFRKYYDETVDDDVTTKGGFGSSFGLSSSSGIRLGVRF